MKRIVICCDGTWQSLENDWPTNVQRVAQFTLPSGHDGTSQVLYYDSGVGVFNAIDRVAGGAFGDGLDREVAEAYRFLSLNFEAGDELYLFGFSRGAYTVRSLAGLIYSCGIVKRNKLRSIPYAMELYRDREVLPSHDECQNFRSTNSILEEGSPPKITFLGCWDTVGALGVPDAIPLLPLDDWLGRKFEFHDTNLGSHILHARHAVAIDERRSIFDVTNMNPPRKPLEGHTLREVWFPGDHAGVGGGERTKRHMSDGALLWMIDEAREVGLEFCQDEIDDFTAADPLKKLDNRVGWLSSLTDHEIDRSGPRSFEEISSDARSRWREVASWRPQPLMPFTTELNQSGDSPD